ncbi:putative OSBP(oxysterol binding protein)-related protein 4B [Cucumis melo var. makuwa]|uniref:Putative OSBP(Oxysterol binding protein)-related protein 4B n=1 Tax=Cucumis melo var. makuwa TaxID=1194695 RepID=A0A5D3BQA0_CUCMM|nr:putative OSBP(oxysterol binding protein)-related protein 4B [Cucumis melo var. makuwa]
MEGQLFHWDMKNKVISRTSSIGCSSHSIYYSGTANQGVPFKWETQPGTPKDPPPQDLLPPLSPPPAVLSLGVPKPACIDQPKSRSLPRMRLRFWKKIMKSRDGGRAAQTTPIDHYNDKLETFSFLSSDCEFMASPSPRDSMSSSSTSSSSSSPSSFIDSLNVGNTQKVSFGRPSSWNNAWQINRMLVCYHS